MNEINISLDDVKGIFKVLAKGQADSIFETRTLSFLREMNRKYGTKFDLFCTYKHDSYSLDIVSDKYIKEFLDNADWLRFGFHCYDEMDEYKNSTEIYFEKKINLFLWTKNKTLKKKMMKLN